MSHVQEVLVLVPAAPNRVLTRTSQARHPRHHASLEVRDLLNDNLSTLETLESDKSPCNVPHTEVVLPPPYMQFTASTMYAR